MTALRIVLVEPQEAGNVGAVARAMKNFGFAELWIVGQHPQLLPVSSWWASGADDLLERVRFVPTLADALGDAHVTVATTSMRGRTTPVTFTPKTLAARYAEMGDDQTLALVFGREDSGLTREELVLCQYSVTIPTNDAFPTMNLAQSVCVFCYELSQTGAIGGREAGGRSGRRSTTTLPDAATLERIHQRARDLLREVGFLHENNPDRIYDDLRAIVARAELDAREATIVLGIIRQIEWKVRTGSRESGSGTPR
jgi:tRNA/rRNA methyltransferase